MQTLVQVVLAVAIAALLLILLVVVLAIQVMRMFVEIGETAAEHPADETEPARY